MAAKSAIMTIMKRASERAARSLLRDFGEVEHLQVSRKGPCDFVSAADKRSEEIIFNDLKKARPNYHFLMEEGGKVEGSEDSDYCWIIDPLDGTTNFLHGVPHWAISIALEHKGEVVAALIHDPVKDEIFYAEKGNGAFIERKSRLRVSGRNQTDTALIAMGDASRYGTEKRKKFLKEFTAMNTAGFTVRRYGAAALDLAYVAAGRYEGFWERDLSPWDIAAGILIVKESGGFISELDDIRKNPVYTGNILATNENLSDDISRILRKVS